MRFMETNGHIYKNTVIAIDGPAASGKGTLAKKLSREFDYALLDTGLLYRAVGLMVLNQGQDPDNPKAATQAAELLTDSLGEETLKNPKLRGNEVAIAASKVSAVPMVRQVLLDLQRNFARTPPDGKSGAVLDGRDIGTIVCPDADFKFFVTATPEIRAERRSREKYGEKWLEHYETLLAQTIERDERDSNRPIAPLKPAFDAIILDTTHMDIETVFATALKEIYQQTS